MGKRDSQVKTIQVHGEVREINKYTNNKHVLDLGVHLYGYMALKLARLPRSVNDEY